MVKSTAKSQSKKRNTLGKLCEDPTTCMKKWLRLNRRETHNAERLVGASCSAAVLASDTGTATEDHCHNAGKLLLRGHCCSEVVLSHMLHREGLGRYDNDTSFYNMLVPWAEGQVTMSDVMRHASVHSCFHVALAGRGSSRS